MGVFKRSGSKKQNGGQEFSVWWYQFRFRGALIRESAKTKSREVAERLMRERRRKLELGQAGLKEIAKPKTLAVASSEWVTLRKPGWSKNQHRIETTNLKRLLPHFGKLLLSDIDHTDVARYQAARKVEEYRGKPTSPKTINLEVATLRSVMIENRRWADIAPDVKMLRVREDVGRALSADEQHRLLTACKASRSRALYSAFLVSLHTGLRSSELRHLQWHNVDLVERMVTVGKSKTQAGEGRKVPLSNEALKALQDWRRLFPDAKPGHYVFCSERYGLDGQNGRKGGKAVPYSVDPTKPISSFKVAWNNARKVAKVECRWHDARHSFLSRLGERAVSDRTMMALAGHVSKKMLERYSHISNSAKRDAISAAFGTEPEAPKVKQPKQVAPEGGTHFRTHSENDETGQVM
jgi:integrase